MSRRTIGSLLVRLGMDTKEADKAIKNFDRNLKNTAKNMESIGTKMSLAFTLPLAALAKQSLTAYDKQVQAEKRLQVALGGTSKALLAQATAIQKVTTFGDEAIIEQQAFLASLGLSEKQIMDTTQAAVNLSASLGISLESATKNLAKTTAGLTGELGELIPGLKQFTPEQLKAGAAIEYANKQFKGYAEAAAQVGTGPLKQLQNQLGDLGEELGRILLPVVKQMVEWVKKAADAFAAMDESTKKAIVVFGAMVATAGPLMTYLSVIPRLVKWTLDFGDALDKIGGIKVVGGSALAIVAALFGAASTGALAGDMSGLFGAMEKNTGKEFGTWDKLKMGMSIGTGFNTLGGAAGVAQGMFMSTIKPEGSAAASPFWPSTGSPYVMVDQTKTKTNNKLPPGPPKPKDKGIALDMYFDAFSPVGSQYAGVDWSVDALPMLSGGITGGGGGLSAEGMGSILPDMSQNLQENMGFWREWSGTVVGAMSELGAALAEGENFFVAFGKTALNVANQVIQASIGKIIAQIVAGESGKGLVGALLGLAGAGVVVGMLSSMIGKSKSAAPKLAEGGLAYGPTMAVVGDNPNARMDPEVISPLSKLKKMIGNAGAQTVQVVGVIRGDDILLQTSRANSYAVRRGAGNAITF